MEDAKRIGRRAAIGAVTSWTEIRPVPILVFSGTLLVEASNELVSFILAIMGISSGHRRCICYEDAQT